MTKMRQSAPTSAIHRSYFEPSSEIFVGRRGAGDRNLGVLQRSRLERFFGRRPDRIDPRYALGRRGIAPMRNDESSRFPVRRHEGSHRALEVRVLEDIGGQIERIVVLGGVERLPHGGGVLARVVQLTEEPGHWCCGSSTILRAWPPRPRSASGSAGVAAAVSSSSFTASFTMMCNLS